MLLITIRFALVEERFKVPLFRRSRTYESDNPSIWAASLTGILRRPPGMVAMALPDGAFCVDFPLAAPVIFPLLATSLLVLSAVLGAGGVSHASHAGNVGGIIGFSTVSRRSCNCAICGSYMAFNFVETPAIIASISTGFSQHHPKDFASFPDRIRLFICMVARMVSARNSSSACRWR